jgi:xyloglucan-specific exo-beta-1,4-glucanase
MKYLQLAQLLLATAAPIKAAFTWQNVKIGGGGGFVPGIVFHPKTKVRTRSRPAQSASTRGLWVNII